MSLLERDRKKVLDAGFFLLRRTENHPNKVAKRFDILVQTPSLREWKRYPGFVDGFSTKEARDKEIGLLLAMSNFLEV